MTILQLTSNIAQGSASSSAVTLDSTGANLIIVTVSGWSSGGTVTITDTYSNTWTGLTRAGSSDPAVRHFYCLSPSTGASHTFTGSASNMYGSISVRTFSGVDAYVSNFGNEVLPGTSITPTAITPPSDGCLLVAGEAFGATSTESGAGTFTGLNQVNYSAGTCYGLATSYYVQPTAGSTSETFSGSNINRAASLCCFTAAAATGQPASRRMGGVKFSRNQSLGLNRW